ncbi:hypothetical protein BGZ80_002911, partial [Entomortierella chlamydospora]
MIQSLFSSKTSHLSPEEALELVNERLELAFKEDDIAKKLKFVNSANSWLKDAENIFVSKKVKDPALTEGIVHAYHEHGRLLDDLGHHYKAKKSHSSAEKWGYAHVASRHAGSSNTLGKSDTIRRSPLPTAALSVAPSIATAMHQGSSKADVTQLNHQDHTLHSTPTKVNNDKSVPNKDGMQIQQKIFDQDVTPPIA